MPDRALIATTARIISRKINLFFSFSTYLCFIVIIIVIIICIYTCFVLRLELEGFEVTRECVVV